MAPIEVIEGCALGADRIAEDWARINHVTLNHFPASWVTYGRGAGAIRNAQMLQQKPDMVVAFDLGTPGTADMVRRSLAAGVKVRVVTPGGLF